MSDWLFDLGNSRLKFAPLVDGRPGEVVALAHDGAGFADGWTSRLPDRLSVAHVSSVAASSLRANLFDALAARSRRLSLATTQARWDGVRIAYAQPRRLGVDRFLSLLAAHARGGAWLVAGVGTALTLDLIDDEGRHHGGRIAPSPGLMREALHARAAQLPVQGGDYRDFADDTDDALASGCLGAALALVAQSRDAAAVRLGTRPSLLLHGGGGEALRERIAEAHWAPSLVLEGLARWAMATTDP